MTAVCPPTTQIECTVRPIANVHPPTVLGGQWSGDTGTYDLQGTRSVDFDEKQWLLILGLSFLTGQPPREIDRDGATKCPAGTPTLEGGRVPRALSVVLCCRYWLLGSLRLQEY